MSASDIDWLYDPVSGRKGMTWNFTLGCEEVSDEECGECYAKIAAHIRASNPNPKIAAAYAGLTERIDGRTMWTGRINVIEDRLTDPLSWRPGRRVFVDSMSDLFHKTVTDEDIARVFAVMALCPQHTFILLTKRHARMRALLNDHRFWTMVGLAALELRDVWLPEVGVSLDAHALPNVVLGVSAGNQHWADIRVPELLRTPAAARCVSAEPLVGPIDFRAIPHNIDALHGGLNWVIVGGQSGSKTDIKPMHPEWARSIRDQCVKAGVAFYFKQWGSWAPIGPLYGDSDETDAAHMEAVHLEVVERKTVVQLERSGDIADGYQPADPRTWLMARVGKKAAGRELDGAVWDQYPESAVAR
jgi:protein gp37